MTIASPSRQTLQRCEDERQPNREALSVADEELLWIGQARELLSAEIGYPLSEDAVRAYADSGHLKAIRPPAAGPGHSRRRITRASVLALAEAMKMSPGPERSAEMAKLQGQNAG